MTNRKTRSSFLTRSAFEWFAVLFKCAHGALFWQSRRDHNEAVFASKKDGCFDATSRTELGTSAVGYVVPKFGMVFGAALFGLFCVNPAFAQSKIARLTITSDPQITLLRSAASNPELQAKIDKLLQESASAGQVDIVIRLSVPWAAEPLLSDDDKAKQRADFAEASARIERSLGKVGLFAPEIDKPYVKLIVDNAALRRLLTLRGIVMVQRTDEFNWYRDFVRMRVGKDFSQSSSQNGTQGSDITPFIVGGGTAASGEHPFQVGLLTKSISNNFNAQFCGGTLVAARYVVTAAHCSDTISNAFNEVQVLVGTQSLDGTGQRINVSQVRLHPNWNANTYDYDVAVWELSTSVSGIAFASLASSVPSTPGQLLRVTGWGSLTYQGSYPTVLQQVDVPYVPTDGSGYCESQGGITSRMICAGQVGKDSCQGDSGGPLTMNTGSGYNVLVGIVSFGNGCGWANYPGVYANVSNSNINSFITGIISPSTFSIAYTKSGTAAGTVSFSPAGTKSSCSSSCTNTYATDTTVTLTATPGSGARFVGWSGTGGCTGTSTCTLRMSEARAVTATFSPVQTFSLTYTKSGTSAGTVSFSPSGTRSSCSSSCSNSYASGTTVTLTATPGTGARFAGWSGRGGCSGTGTCTLSMSAARAVTATFSPIPTYAISYTKAGSAAGTVSFSPAGSRSSCSSSCSNSYASGTTVTLTAIPGSGAAFAGWSGRGGCTGTGTCTLSMSAARAVTATFNTASTFNLSVTKAGPGSGTVTFSPAVTFSSCTSNCTNSYMSGTNVTLTAQSNASPASEISRLADPIIKDQSTPMVDILAQARAAGALPVIIHVRSDADQIAMRESLSSKAGRTRLAEKHKALVEPVIRSVARTVQDETSKRLRRFEVLPAFAVRLTAEEINLLADNSAVVRIEVDRKNKPFLDSSLSLINMPAAKTAGATGNGRIVAVIDDGVQASHPFISAARILNEGCFLASSTCPNNSTRQYGVGASAPRGSNTHGTHVSGIAMGYRASGTNPSAGVASSASLIMANVFDTSGGAYNSDIYAALEWIISLKVNTPTLAIDSVNMSLGASVPWSGDCDASEPTYKQLFDQLRSLGIIPVVAAGNDSWTSTMATPACVSSALSVASSKKTKNQISYYSNISATTDVIAPGGDVTDGGSIMSSIAGSKYGTMQGTSMAAPHVAGLITALRTVVPSATVSQIEAALRNTGVSITDQRFGGSITKPRVNALAALQSLQSQSGTFAGWSGDCSGSNSTCTVNMNATKSVTATFNTPVTNYTLSISKSGTGSGTITSSPSGISCGATCSADFASGTSMTLTASPSGSSTFGSWSGCDSTSGTSCTVSLSSSRAVSASFNGAVSCSGIACPTDNTLIWQSAYSNAAFYSQSSYISGLSGSTAAQSGSTPNSGYSCISTTIQAPGLLDVIWSVSSEIGYDWMDLYLDNTLVNGYSGNGIGTNTWFNEVYQINGSGPANVKFCYSKDNSISSHLDAGFIDRVSYSYSGASAGVSSRIPVGVIKVGSRLVDRDGKALPPSAGAGIAVRFGEGIADRLSTPVPKKRLSSSLN